MSLLANCLLFYFKTRFTVTGRNHMERLESCHDFYRRTSSIDRKKGRRKEVVCLCKIYINWSAIYLGRDTRANSSTTGPATLIYRLPEQVRPGIPNSGEPRGLLSRLPAASPGNEAATHHQRPQ